MSTNKWTRRKKGQAPTQAHLSTTPQLVTYFPWPCWFLRRGFRKEFENLWRSVNFLRGPNPLSTPPFFSAFCPHWHPEKEHFLSLGEHSFISLFPGPYKGPFHFTGTRVSDHNTLAGRTIIWSKGDKITQKFISQMETGFSSDVHSSLSGVPPFLHWPASLLAKKEEDQNQ